MSERGNLWICCNNTLHTSQQAWCGWFVMFNTDLICFQFANTCSYFFLGSSCDVNELSAFDMYSLFQWGALWKSLDIVRVSEGGELFAFWSWTFYKVKHPATARLHFQFQTPHCYSWPEMARLFWCEITQKCYTLLFPPSNMQQHLILY